MRVRGDDSERHAGLAHALLEVPHAFGTLASAAPPDVWRPRQVHGARVLRAESATDADADAILTTRRGQAVGVVTADCVPILAVAGAGERRAVLAVHAGWRGLARGVVANAFRALAEVTRDATHPSVGRMRAVIGPCARGCCYEVDAPVLRALEENFAAVLPAATRASRPGHVWLDLAALAAAAVRAAGVRARDCAVLPDACTICDARFASHRREPARGARMLHWIRLS